MTFKTLVLTKIIPLLDAAVNLIMAISVLGFIAGLTIFIATAGNDQKRAQGKRWMTWSVIALFLMITIWGIVKIMKVTFFSNL